MKSILLIAVITAEIAYGQSYPAPNESRIAEIAGWLSEEPSAAGARITDRKTWNRYRGSPGGKQIIAQAASLSSQDVPDMPPV